MFSLILKVMLILFTFICFAFVSLLTLYETLEDLHLFVPFSVGQAHY